MSDFHHSPDDRHGPAQRITFPPAKPRRSVVTRTGRSSTTATRAGTGWRQRRTAEGRKGWKGWMGEPAAGPAKAGRPVLSSSFPAFPAPPAPPALPALPAFPALPAHSVANGAIANAPGRYESTTAGAPK